MRWAPGIVGRQLMWNQKGELRAGRDGLFIQQTFIAPGVCIGTVLGAREGVLFI